MYDVYDFVLSIFHTFIIRSSMKKVKLRFANKTRYYTNGITSGSNTYHLGERLLTAGILK